MKDRLELPDYLIMPVQRITKYSLLLQDFHKFSVRAGLDAGNIEAALEVTRGISSRANNTIHLSMVEGVEPRFGELVLQVCLVAGNVFMFVTNLDLNGSFLGKNLLRSFESSLAHTTENSTSVATTCMRIIYMLTYMYMY